MVNDPERQALRDALLRRYDALEDAAFEAGAYGPLRLEPFPVHDVLTGAAAQLDPVDGIMVRDELTRRVEVVTDLHGLLAKVAVAAVAVKPEAFERLETVTLEAITRGGDENHRQSVLEQMRPRIEAVIERAEEGDRVPSYLHPAAADAVHWIVSEAKDAACRGEADRCEALLARAHAKLDVERTRYPPEKDSPNA